MADIFCHSKLKGMGKDYVRKKGNEVMKKQGLKGGMKPCSSG
jgi:hypothetical protein